MEIIDLLRSHVKYIKASFAVKRIGLFGSFARGEQKESSDIDILVEFEKPTFRNFMDLSFYLEDLFVLPEYRRKKAGYALFRAMVAEAHNRGCGRMEWTVLDWNQLAKDFYERLGAKHMKEWQLFRLMREDMSQILGKTRGTKTEKREQG